MADKRPNEKNNGETASKKYEARKTHPTPTWVYLAFAVILIVSYVTLPQPLQPPHGEEPTIQHVFYYGWLTAVSTGLGALPLAFAPNLSAYWVGISNGKLRE
jgi:hypothetical protein